MLGPVIHTPLMERMSIHFNLPWETLLLREKFKIYTQGWEQ